MKLFLVHLSYMYTGIEITTLSDRNRHDSLTTAKGFTFHPMLKNPQYWCSLSNPVVKDLQYRCSLSNPVLKDLQYWCSLSNPVLKDLQYWCSLSHPEIKIHNTDVHFLTQC